MTSWISSFVSTSSLFNNLIASFTSNAVVLLGIVVSAFV